MAQNTYLIKIHPQKITIITAASLSWVPHFFESVTFLSMSQATCLVLNNNCLTGASRQVYDFGMFSTFRDDKTKVRPGLGLKGPLTRRQQSPDMNLG